MKAMLIIRDPFGDGDIETKYIPCKKEIKDNYYKSKLEGFDKEEAVDRFYGKFKAND